MTYAEEKIVRCKNGLRSQGAWCYWYNWSLTGVTASGRCFFQNSRKVWGCSRSCVFFLLIVVFNVSFSHNELPHWIWFS